MALLTLFLLAVAAANPGIKMSQDSNSFSLYVQNLIQTYAKSISFVDMADISYKSPLGQLRTMDVNVTNINVKNLGFSNYSTAVVSLAAPNKLNVAVANLTGTVTFTCSIKGKGLSLNKNGTAELFSSHLIVNSTVGVSEGMPTLTLSVSEMVVSNVTLAIAPIPMQLYDDLQVHLATALTTYLTANATALYQTMCDEILTAGSLRWLSVNSKMNMDASWTQAPLIVANATAQYIVFYLNGTVVPAEGVVPQNNNPIPVAMPDRLLPAPGQGPIHSFISQYVLESFMWSYYLYGSVQVGQSDLPPDFPSMLNTASGYFPELAAKYGSNVPVSLNISLTEEPLLAIDETYGLRTTASVWVALCVGGAKPVSFQVDLLYYSSLYISGSVFQGYPLTPILTVDMVTTTIGVVNAHYLSLFAKDFFAAAAKSAWSMYLFPSFPMLVPAGATSARFVRSAGYIAVDLQPSA